MLFECLNCKGRFPGETAFIAHIEFFSSYPYAGIIRIRFNGYKGRGINKLNRLTCLFGRLLRCIEAHILQVCALRYALKTKKNPA